MRIEIEIPKEFESDYTGDKFKDFFSRVLCDIEEGVMCGNYEKEIANMFIEAFDKSKAAYNVEKVVAELNDYYEEKLVIVTPQARERVEDIVRNGGKE